MKPLADRLLESPALSETSMSYCAFENTATEMGQVVRKLTDIARLRNPVAGLKSLSSHEMDGYQELKQLCKQFLEMSARIGAATDEEEDDFDEMRGDFPPERE
jgi:hypothetical protein